MVATNQDVSHLRDAVLEWKRFARIRIVLLEIAVNSESTGHKAVFPRALPEFFIKAFSDPGDIVFDPFCGSGTTLAAASWPFRIRL
jgi:DNA modification methylase